MEINEELKSEIIKTELLMKNDEKLTNLDKIKFANALKNGMGEIMKNELINPPIYDNKAARKLKRKRFWSKLKEDLKMFFFNKKIDNEFDVY
jgi:hypothetical protein